MATVIEERLNSWLALWQQALPRQSRGQVRDWQAALERFLVLLKADLAAAPISWWSRVRLLYRLQKALAAQGVPGEALRPLVLAIILRVYLG